MGEAEAFLYFDELAKNIQSFSTSGSGPINSLVRGEAAIGIGMIFQAVQINKGAKIEILPYAEGQPYNVSGGAVIKGRSEKSARYGRLSFYQGRF